MEIAAADGTLTCSHTEEARQGLKYGCFARTVTANKNRDAAIQIDLSLVWPKATEVPNKDACNFHGQLPSRRPSFRQRFGLLYNGLRGGILKVWRIAVFLQYTFHEYPVFWRGPCAPCLR